MPKLTKYLLGSALWLATVTAAASGSSGAEVTRKSMGAAWPLVVKQGTLACLPGPRPGLQSLTVSIGGVAYALNGTARATGHPELGENWLADASNPGAKVSLAPMVAKARALCSTAPL